MSKISELSTKRNKLIADAQALVNEGKAASEEYRAMIAEIDGTQDHIDMLAKIERMMPTQSAPVAAPVAPAITKQDESPEHRRAKLNASYRHFLQHGYQPQHTEQRDLQVNGNGAAVIPQEFDSAYVSALKFYGPIAALAKTKNADDGRMQKFTISDDTTATMTYLSDSGSTAGVEADPTLRSAIPGTDSLVTVVKYSLQELEDAFSLESFIRDIAGLRVARAVEYALTLGKDNGTNTALPNSPVGGLLGSVGTGTVTASLADGIGYADLVALAGSVDHAYYVNGAYMASPSVHNYLLSQKDSTSRPYYNVDPDSGLLMINGKPLYVNNAMSAYNAASSPVVLFGDFSRAYVYLNGGGMRIRVLSERYIDTFEAAAVIYHRIGAANLVSGAVKAMVTAVS